MFCIIEKITLYLDLEEIFDIWLFEDNNCQNFYNSKTKKNNCKVVFYSPKEIVTSCHSFELLNKGKTKPQER